MTTTGNKPNPLIIALDTNDLSIAEKLVQETREFCEIYKVGLELFSAHNTAALNMLRQFGAKIFLDLKLHDIPNTVEKAVRAFENFPIKFLTIHALGGEKMVQAAQKALKETQVGCTLLAVSILTSHPESELIQLGLMGSSNDCAIRLIELAFKNGAMGCVCSPRESSNLRASFGNTLTIVTPGIRPAWAAKNDQERIATPTLALNNGANYLVVGRPITQSTNPHESAKKIYEEIAHC